MLTTTNAMSKYKGFEAICIAFSTLACFQSVTSAAIGADPVSLLNVNSSLGTNENNTTPFKILDDASNRVNIIYSTDLFEAIGPGVLHFIGNDSSEVLLSCQGTKSKTDFVRWNIYGHERRAIESMKPENDQNGIIINLASGPPVIRLECCLKENKTILNNTLIYTGAKNPPYLYKHEKLLRATVLNATTASLPCLQKYPSNSNGNRKLHLFKDGKKIEENETDWLSYSPELGYLLKLPKLGNPLGTYECRIENSSTDDFLHVLFDTSAFINVSYKARYFDHIYAGSPQKRQFECQLPKNKFENQFKWYYQWNNSSYSHLDSDYLVVANDPFYNTYYSQTVGVTFPSENVNGIVCVGTAKDSESTYNNSYAVKVKESYPPKILNKLSDKPIIYTPGRNLSCHTTTEPLHFDWLKNGKAATDGEDIHTDWSHPPFQTTIVLTKPNEDYTNYTCKLSNFHGSVQHNFRVRFLENIGNFIEVRYKGNSHEFYAGQALQQTFECDLPNEIFEHGFEWFYHWSNGSYTRMDPENDLYDDDFSNSSYFQTVKTTFSSIDIIGIACAGTVKGSTSRYNNSYPINVKKAREPQNLTFEPKEPIIYTNGLNLTCYTTADPISSWSWYKNGELVKHENISSNSSSPGQSTLSLGQLVDTIDSTYTCVASNFLGTASHRFIVPAAANSLVVGIAVCVGVAALLLLVLVLSVYSYKCTDVKHDVYDGDEESGISNQTESGSINLPRIECANTNSNHMKMELQECELNEEQQEMVSEIETNSELQNGEDNENDENLERPLSFEHAVKHIKIEAVKLLNNGNFGTVFQAILTDSELNTRIKLAIKTVIFDPEANKRDQKDKVERLLNEMKTWKNLSYHPNVVSYIGGVHSDIPNDTAHLLVEYCNGGDMETYLRKFKSNSDSPFYFYDENKGLTLNLKGQQVLLRISHLMIWAEQCANGLEFLRSQRVVHRDLAARNILLHSQSCEDDEDKNPGNYVAKITDFDLSRVVKNVKNYCYQSVPGPDKPALPVAWMALEALKCSEYTTESDVWSLGILFWEMFTLAKESPYCSFGIPVEQMELIHFLESGGRLAKPECAPQEMKDIMKKCWRQNPKKRPKVCAIYYKLKKFNETNRNISLGENADAIDANTHKDTRKKRSLLYVQLSKAPEPESEESLSDHCEETLEIGSCSPSNSAGPSNHVIIKKYMSPSKLQNL